jgi:hypothetical protein
MPEGCHGPAVVVGTCEAKRRPRPAELHRRPLRAPWRIRAARTLHPSPAHPEVDQRSEDQQNHEGAHNQAPAQPPSSTSPQQFGGCGGHDVMIPETEAKRTQLPLTARLVRSWQASEPGTATCPRHGRNSMDIVISAIVAETHRSNDWCHVYRNRRDPDRGDRFAGRDRRSPTRGLPPRRPPRLAALFPLRVPAVW